MFWAFFHGFVQTKMQKGIIILRIAMYIEACIYGKRNLAGKTIQKGDSFWRFFCKIREKKAFLEGDSGEIV